MLQRIYGASAKRARLLNVGMLVAGYGFGQGSIFLAQTWLMAQEKLHLLALFGTHFSFAMFGIITVEAGSLITLARHAASMTEGDMGREAHEHSMWRKFWEVSTFRTALALAVIATILIGALAFPVGEFSRNYALFAAPAFLIWAINAAGFLDGLKLSGISGISGSVAYVASAAALLAVDDLSISSAGAVLGGAFTIGYALTVAIQVIALRAAGWKVRFVRPDRIGIATAAREGAALLGSTLPGQFYFRGQLLMCGAWLGVGPTAILVYVKQVIAAVTQLIGFIRRVEFPNLVSRLAKDASTPIATILYEQRLGTWLAVLITGVVVLVGLTLTQIPSDLPDDLGIYLALFSVTIITGVTVLALAQGLSALGMYNSLFLRSVASTAVGMAASALLIGPLGLTGLLIADVASALAGIAIFLTYFRKKK